MKFIKLFSVVVLILFLGISACSENPVKPEEKPEPFPLTYKFKNIGDTTAQRFDVRFVAYYPKVDSSSLIVTGLNNAAIGYQIEETMDKDGLPGVEMYMVFGVVKKWGDRSNQDYNRPSKKWFYIEHCIVADSSRSTMSLVWPNDTTRADVHGFKPDTTDADFMFWGPNGTKENC